ncbi:MAG: hypothetical protein ACOX5W_07030 [Bacillota bacterium]|jgi:hypothetical protein
MTMTKPVKTLIYLAIFLSIPLMGFLCCKMLVDTEENPQEWTKNNNRVAFTSIYGSTAHKNYIASVLPVKDGGYILAGNIIENPNFTMRHKLQTQTPKTIGGADSWLIKTDALGNKIWERPIFRKGSDSIASAQQTADGGYILAGYTDTEAGNTDGWLVKTDSEGNPIWSQTYSCGSLDAFTAVQQTRDGGYILAGWANFPNDDRYDDGWLIKTDAEGKEIWSRNLGDSKGDAINSIQQTNDGGYIAAGQTISPVSEGYDAWLVRLDADGQVAWSHTFGGALEDVFYSVSTTADGGYIIAGRTQPDNEFDYDGWLIKTDSAGREVWSRTYNASIKDQVNEVRQTRDGGYILAGCTGAKDNSGVYCIGDGWVIKTDAQGQEVWSYTFGGKNPDSFSSVQQTEDGGYTLGGWASSTKTGEPTGWLLKLKGEEAAPEIN